MIWNRSYEYEKEWLKGGRYKILFLLFFIPLIGWPGRTGNALITRLKPDPPVKKEFPQGYFVVPTDSNLSIAGNFGEIRPNHFHAGLDIKTGGREGLFIYAAAEGYVSRVKISATGYGKALYVTHPNGFVTVYAHLQRLYGNIAKYVERKQYEMENFEIDIEIPKDSLKVKQCDTIAISGNTGGSQSPHLHFEIRDAQTEVAYNPLLFGYRFDDSVSPNLVTLAVYPATDSSTVNGKKQPRRIRLYGSKGKYTLPASEKLTVSGDIGFGIEAYDYANIRQAGKLGAYSIELKVDGKKIYYHEMNEIAFDESRYINSHIDYADEARTNREIQKCFRDENNKLSIYQCMVNEGLCRFDDSLSHEVNFLVKDFFGNTSELGFRVKSKIPVKETKEKKENEKVKHFKCAEENRFSTPDISLNIKPCSLYENLDFDYAMSKDTLPGTLAPVHTIHQDLVPLHYFYSLSVKVKKVPDQYKEKAVLVILDGKDNKSNANGTWIDSSDGTYWVKTSTRSFGRYTAALDTVAPFIKPYNIYNGKNMKGSKLIGIVVGDNLTGINTYRATVDGKWVLLQYEPKKALLFYEFDEHVGSGKHTFRVEVTDRKNNVNSYEAAFSR